MKKTKIVVPALAVLLLSTAASVSGTVAWFSMNTSINVTGMTVTTKVSSSLQIAASNEEALFSNADLPQTRAGLLEPASSVDGATFFYTTNAKANGDANADQYVQYDEHDIRNGDDPRTTSTTENDFSNALSEAYANATGKTSYDPKFHDAYGFPAYDASAATAIAAQGNPSSNEVPFAYIDYSFYLKANIVGSSQKIAMDRCNLLYNNGLLNTEWAWRVALFAHAVDPNTNEADSATAVAGNLVTILDLAKSKNQNEVRAQKLAADASTSGWFNDPQLTTAATPATADGNTVYYQGSGETAPKAVSGAAVAPTAVTNPNAAANVASGVTGNRIYKVVVRLWLEGEDVSCTSETFATLTQAWSLNISFKLGGDDGVTAISNTPGMDFTQH